MSRTLKFAAIGALLLTMVVGTAHAALTPAQEFVADGLARIGRELAKVGFVLSSATTETVLRNGWYARTTALTAGRTYAVAIACDADCDSAVVQVLDENGNAVGERIEGLPVLRIRAPWTGTYQVKVRLLKCRTSACEVGVAVFSV